MRYSSERNRTDKDDFVYLAIAVTALAVFIVLFCIIVWLITHRGNDDIVINNSPAVTETGGLNTSGDSDVVAPVESSSEEEQSLEPGVDYNDTSNDLGLVFTEVHDVVTAIDVTNLRSEPSTGQGAATVITQLNNGETAIRIGKEDNTGWSKLVYDGQIVYASTNYLKVVE